MLAGILCPPCDVVVDEPGPWREPQNGKFREGVTLIPRGAIPDPSGKAPVSFGQIPVTVLEIR